MALLDRVLQRGPDGDGFPAEESRMTVIEHLEALRRVLIISAVAWLIATGGAFFFWKGIFEFILHRAGLTYAIFTGPTGGIFLGLKIALYVGIVISAPVLIQQIWWFVSPGLHKHERRLILPLIIATSIFFLIGCAFALYALPLFMKILFSFAPPDLHALIIGDELLGFVLAMIIGFGLVFELPVVLYSLGLMRIINSRWLYKNRGYWLIALGVISNVLTPGVDPITPLIMFVPLYIFWEATALLLKLTGR